jgi:hypothetical protein
MTLNGANWSDDIQAQLYLQAHLKATQAETQPKLLKELANDNLLSVK